MNSLKMKDLLVSIRPEESRHQQGRLLPAGHFMAMPKCVQPSKSIPLVVGAAAVGPTKQTTEQNGLMPAEPCPCPSKTVEEETTRMKTTGQSFSTFRHNDLSSANALAELKKALAALETSMANLH